MQKFRFCPLVTLFAVEKYGTIRDMKDVLTAVITGATGGIGTQLCRCFAAHGVWVAVCYHSRQQAAGQLAQQLASDYGVRAIAVCMDMDNPATVQQAFDYIRSVFGHVDYLVNNAGVALIKPLSMVTPAEWQHILNVDLSAAFYTSKQVLDDMYHRGGSIVNVSSMWGQLGASCEVPYSAAKAGLEGFTRALAQEYPPAVRITAVSLGFVDTPMNNLTPDEQADFFRQNPTMRLLSPVEAADFVYHIATTAPTGTIAKLGW